MSIQYIYVFMFEDATGATGWTDTRRETWTWKRGESLMSFMFANPPKDKTNKQTNKQTNELVERERERGWAGGGFGIVGDLPPSGKNRELKGDMIAPYLRKLKRS